MSSQTKDMTKGNIFGLLIGFMLPMMAGNLFQQLYSLVDTVIVGKGLGDAALAAVGNTGILNWLIFGFAIGLTSGLGIHVAQSFGAGDLKRLHREVAMSTLICLVITIVLMVLCLPLLRTFFVWLNTPDELMDQCLEYLNVILWGTFATIFNNLAMVMLRSVGNSRIPLISMILSALLNIALDLLFVFPLHMGVFGAAFATVLAQLFSFVFCFIFILRIPELIPEKDDWKLRLPIVRYLTLKGLPVAFMNSITAIGGLVIQYFINSMGTVYLAAYSACIKLCCLFEQAGVSVGMAVMTFVGQNYGARRFDRLQKGVRYGLLLTVIVNTPIILAQLFLPMQMTSLMLNDPETIAHTPEFFHILAIGYFPLGFLFINRYATQAMGHTFVPMLSGFVEVLMRVTCAILFIGPLALRGAAICEISAYIGAWLMLWVTFSIYYRKDRKKFSVE